MAEKLNELDSDELKKWNSAIYYKEAEKENRFFQHHITGEWCVGSTQRYYSTKLRDKIAAIRMIRNKAYQIEQLEETERLRLSFIAAKQLIDLESEELKRFIDVANAERIGERFFKHPISCQWCVGSAKEYFSTGIKDREQAIEFLRKKAVKAFPGYIPPSLLEGRFEWILPNLKKITPVLFMGLIVFGIYFCFTKINWRSTPPEKSIEELMAKAQFCANYPYHHHCIGGPDGSDDTDFYSSNSGTGNLPGYHYIDSYTRSDGTVVDGHMRSNPDGITSNNINGR